MNSKEQMDNRIYNASVHLFEAAKYMSDVNQEFAAGIIALADRLLSVLNVPEQKVSDERMDEILNEILNAEK